MFDAFFPELIEDLKMLEMEEKQLRGCSSGTKMADEAFECL